jgi:hypothetical protein
VIGDDGYEIRGTRERWPTRKLAISRAKFLIMHGQRVDVLREIKFSIKI